MERRAGSWVRADEVQPDVPGPVLEVRSPDSQPHAARDSGFLRLEQIVDDLLGRGRGDSTIADQLRELAQVAQGQVTPAFDSLALPVGGVGPWLFPDQPRPTAQQSGQEGGHRVQLLRTSCDRPVPAIAEYIAPGCRTAMPRSTMRPRKVSCPAIGCTASSRSRTGDRRSFQR